MKKLIPFISILLSVFTYAQKVNFLSDVEYKDGWRLLFDGKTTNGWHTYAKSFSDGTWNVEDEALHCKGAAGDWMSGQEDLTTDGFYSDFHLRLEWKIAPKGNSGIMFRVKEKPQIPPFKTGPEINLVDEWGNTGIRNYMQTCGSIYNLVGAASGTAKPAGEWNQEEIFCKDGYLKILQNGYSIISISIGDQVWRDLIARSAQKDNSEYGVFNEGKIDLQNHGDEVWFRNIKIKDFSKYKSSDDGMYTHYITSTPPKGVFDQKRLPASAIQEWANGIQLAAAGKFVDAVTAFENAASQGNADAAFEIGHYLELSRSFKTDSSLAEQWYQFAKANGHVLAAHRLAVMTYQGRTSAPKETWYSLENNAASQGSSDAFGTLLACYKQGIGVPKNQAKADDMLIHLTKLYRLAYGIASRESIKQIMGAMFDDIVGKIEDVFILAEPKLKDQRSPNHVVAEIEITKFNGHLTQAGGIDEALPFEIECKVLPKPAFLPWSFRINNVILNGKSILQVSRMSALQYLAFSQLEPQMKAALGREYTVGIHDLTE